MQLSEWFSSKTDKSKKAGLHVNITACDVKQSVNFNPHLENMIKVLHGNW